MAADSSATTPSSPASTCRTHKPDRILFGSCNSQHYEQVLWPVIRSRNASAFVWAGDAVYGDDFEDILPHQESRLGSLLTDQYLTRWLSTSETTRWLSSSLLAERKVKPATPQILKELYQNLSQREGYKQILESNMTILGAIDDHDYGCNNGDKTYLYRTESAMEYLNFLQIGKSAALTNLTLMAHRAASGQGVYGVKVFDFERTVDYKVLSDEEAGLEPETIPRTTPLSKRSVAIFLLDVRSNKTPWYKESPMKYQVNPTGDFLGEEQWIWLESALKRSTAAVNIVVSGLQVHADRYFDGNAVEDWSRFPQAQHRLYQALLQSNVQAPIIISGDVHMSEILRKDCRQRPEKQQSFSTPPLTRMLLEVTASGMTHSWGSSICARPHLSWTCESPWIKFSLTMGMHLAHWNGAWTDVVHMGQSQEGAKSGYQYSLDINFGELEFDWEKRQVIVRILGERSIDGKSSLLHTVWDFDTLSGTRSISSRVLFDNHASASSFEPFVSETDWICANYRGPPSLMLKLFGVVSPVSLAAFLATLPLLLPVIIALFLLRRRPCQHNRRIPRGSTRHVSSRSSRDGRTPAKDRPESNGASPNTATQEDSE